MNERDTNQEGGVFVHVLKANEFQAKGETLPKDTTFHLTPADPGVYLSSHNEPRFEQQSITAPKGPLVYVHAEENNAQIRGTHGEGGSILQKIAWEAKHYHPTDYQLKLVKGVANQWSINVGHNPHLPTSITFEDGNPSLEVTFAGHVDTLVQSIIEEYPDNHDLRTFTVSFAASQSYREEDDISLWRTICSPAHLNGEFRYIEYDKRTNTRHPFSYTANGLAYIEVHKSTKRKKDLPHSSIRLSIATIADADKKLRIYHTRWQSLINDGRNKMNKTEKTALCMQYAHVMDLISQTDCISEPFPLDSFEFLDFPIQDAPDAHEFSQSHDRFKTLMKLMPNVKKRKRK